MAIRLIMKQNVNMLQDYLLLNLDKRYCGYLWVKFLYAFIVAVNFSVCSR